MTLRGHFGKSFAHFKEFFPMTIFSKLLSVRFHFFFFRQYCML